VSLFFRCDDFATCVDGSIHKPTLSDCVALLEDGQEAYKLDFSDPGDKETVSKCA